MKENESKVRRYREGFLNGVVVIIGKILFVLGILSIVYLQFKLAVVFFFSYFLLWYIRITWEEKGKQQLTKQKIRDVLKKYNDYTLDAGQKIIDQIKNGGLPIFLASSFIDLFGGYREIEKRKKQVIEDAKIPDYHKSINDEEMQRVGDYFKERFNKIDFYTSIVQLLWGSLFAIFNFYLILQNGGITSPLGFTNLDWYELAGLFLGAIFIEVNRKIYKKFRIPSHDEKVKDSWLTKKLIIEDKRKNVLKNWFSSVVVLVIAIIFTLVTFYINNSLIEFEVYYTITTILGIFTINLDLLFKRNK
jgi:chromate transport protein ChrA